MALDEKGGSTALTRELWRIAWISHSSSKHYFRWPITAVQMYSFSTYVYVQINLEYNGRVHYNVYSSPTMQMLRRL